MFPTEIWHSIFQYLREPKDYFPLRLVCVRFRDWIDLLYRKVISVPAYAWFRQCFPYFKKTNQVIIHLEDDTLSVWIYERKDCLIHYQFSCEDVPPNLQLAVALCFGNDSYLWKKDKAFIDLLQECETSTETLVVTWTGLLKLMFFQPESQFIRVVPCETIVPVLPDHPEPVISGYFLHTSMALNHVVNMRAAVSEDEEENRIILLYEPIGYSVWPPLFKIYEGQLAQRISLHEYQQLERNTTSARWIQIELQKLVTLIPKYLQPIRILVEILHETDWPSYGTRWTSRCSLEGDGCSITLTVI
jgi:hypothetical protein